MSLIRVGNDEYAKQNGSYGLTTLRNHHVKVYGPKIQFRFKGKGGKLHVVGIRNKRLARIIQKCQEIPGYELFQYIDPDGNTVSVDSSDVNAYLREITEQDFTAKDFRTWAATVLMGMALQMRRESRNGNGPTKKDINEAISNVSRLLGNTPAVCRKSYIHPGVIDAYTDGKLDQFWDKYIEQQSAPGLAKEEAMMLSFLRNHSIL